MTNSPFTTYKEDDVIILQKDLTGILTPVDLRVFDTLPDTSGYIREDPYPTDITDKLFVDLLAKSKYHIARFVQTIGDFVLSELDTRRVVLVSVARAGTPYGVLLRRYFKLRGHDIPHYAVAIHKKTLDPIAMHYLDTLYPDPVFVFVDGWTGKGGVASTIKKVYHDSLLAVISDPAKQADIYGTREDYLLPTAVVGATARGLTAPTVSDIPQLSPNDFFGTAYVTELADRDLTNFFIDTVTTCFQLNMLKTDPAYKDRIIQNVFGNVPQGKVRLGGGEVLRGFQRYTVIKLVINPHSSDNAVFIVRDLALKNGIPILFDANLQAYSCGALLL